MNSETTRDRLQETIARHKARADYLEIRLEQSEHTSVAYRGDRLEGVDRGFSLAGGIRACTRGGWSFVTFAGLEELDRRTAEAVSQANLVGSETTQLAEAEAIEDTVAVDLQRDPRGVSLTEKQQLIARYNQMLLDFNPQVRTTASSYSDRFRTTYFANSSGSSIVQERLDVSGRFGAIARDEKGVVRQGFESLRSRCDYGALQNAETRILSAAERAVAQLDAQPARGGQYTVVLDPYLAGVFIHEAFGHLSEADSLYENPAMQAVLQKDKLVAIEALNVTDDATLPGLPGTLKYDDEGVPAGRTDLIRNGRLCQRLHNRETAGKMGDRPTGNARALNATHPPIVRMTNTAIEAGDRTFEEIIADIDDGIYAVRMLGGQTNGEMFTFAAAEGYRIRNGRIAEPISDVTLSGNVFQTLKDIEAIGSDVRYNPGGCGKGNQSPLPVSVGGPHLRIRNVVVGGRSS